MKNYLICLLRLCLHRKLTHCSVNHVFYNSLTFASNCNYLSFKNKKSAESGVAPAGIKSHKFLFVLKKNLFCGIQEIDGLVCKKNGQSRKFGMSIREMVF